MRSAISPLSRGKVCASRSYDSAGSVAAESPVVGSPAPIRAVYERGGRPVARGSRRLRRNELQRDAVVAVTLAGRRRTVVEDVALVAAAAHAVVLGARDKHLVVRLRRDRSGQRRPEARPAGAALELGVRRKQRQVAAGADEAPLALLVVERARSRVLGAFVAQHFVRARAEALLPLCVREAQ